MFGRRIALLLKGFPASNRCLVVVIALLFPAATSWLFGIGRRQRVTMRTLRVCFLVLPLLAIHAYAGDINLGTAASFGVLGASTVTNTGSSVVNNGDVGVYPGSAITGFPPGIIVNGVMHAGDAVAMQAQSDALAAYTVL